MTSTIHEPSVDGRHESLHDIPLVAHRMRDMIVQATRPVILTHGNPDADAVSSALGMRALVRHLGVEPVLTIAGDGRLPENLRFLEGSALLTQVDDAAIAAADLLIFVDCADVERLGPLYFRLTDELERHRPKLNVDHHITNTRFATINLVVPDAASTAEIITDMCAALDLELEPREATAMLAGIYGDTLGLRTPSTTPSALRTAAELIDRGADLKIVVDNLFRVKPFSTIQLWGEALSRAAWRGTLVWTAVDPAMLERAGADRSEAEGIVNFLAGTEGARAAALLHEESWGWRVSMRTLDDEINVAELLGRHGGGGHPRAAGARLPAGREALEHFLADIEAQLGHTSGT